MKYPTRGRALNDAMTQIKKAEAECEQRQLINIDGEAFYTPKDFDAPHRPMVEEEIAKQARRDFLVNQNNQRYAALKEDLQ